MRRVLSVIVVALLAACIGIAPAMAAPGTRLTVVLADPDAGRAFVNVSGVGEVEGYRSSAVIAQGAREPAVFLGLQPGRYSVQVSFDDRPTVWVAPDGRSLPRTTAPPPLVEVGTSPVSVGPVTVPAGAGLTGRLVDSAGAPVQAMNVYATAQDLSQPTRITSGTSGAFGLSGLAETGYTVEADVIGQRYRLVEGPHGLVMSRTGDPFAPGLALGSTTDLGDVIVRDVFADVRATNQFSTEIAWAREGGIVNGYDDGSFRPRAPVNRDAMAAFLYRMAGRPFFDPPAVSPFVDVPPSAAFYREITWLASTGISTGWPDGTFRPLQPVARDAMSAFLFRYVSVAGHWRGTSQSTTAGFQAPSTSPFTDLTTSTPFFREMAWMSYRSVSTGYPDGSFRPSDPVQRDAVAAFLHRSRGF
ncbi:S-layer homology domain-containing protein [Serinibacter arcticus]|uniref:Glycerol-3-phosphate ABC transporter, periplasmic glycerol-3-phosphate-binding protein n=1 Tax=Serinibacter arcticus TaxID=1655435 RepID=A0A4Z1E2K1_9MICO|nr:S-layer homology domain-containing protein [Serinibacter arcticus]TGO06255.1 Glycerol-3-phosphate ABC transporter, periplasmic glycerol-3-phosphate-binding protein [Serinibacter arcticus]